MIELPLPDHLFHQKLFADLIRAAGTGDRIKIVKGKTPKKGSKLKTISVPNRESS